MSSTPAEQVLAELRGVIADARLALVAALAAVPAPRSPAGIYARALVDGAALALDRVEAVNGVRDHCEPDRP